VKRVAKLTGPNRRNNLGSRKDFHEVMELLSPAQQEVLAMEANLAAELGVRVDLDAVHGVGVLLDRATGVTV
jgi:hypothetical protein